MKNNSRLTIIIPFLLLPLFSKAQKLIDRVDSSGYEYYKYDSTITYYWKHMGKSSVVISYLNICPTDSLNKQPFVKKSITQNTLFSILRKYPEPSKNLKLYSTYKNIEITAGLFSTLIVVAGPLIIDHYSNNLEGSLIISLLSELAFISVPKLISNAYFRKALRTYNQILENKR